MYFLLLWLFPDTANAQPQPAGIPFDAGKWWSALGGLVSAAVVWRVWVWMYLDLLRPRLDRFVADARRRRPDDEDAIRFDSRARTREREDPLLIAALARIQPTHDQVVLDAIERNPAEFRALLRDTILREDFDAAKVRDGAASKALAIAEACSTALEGISAAQMAQGRALAELPRISGVMETFAGTVSRMDETLREVNVRLEDMAREQGKTAGVLEEMRRSYAGPEHRDSNPGRRAEDRARMAAFIDRGGDGSDSTG